MHEIKAHQARFFLAMAIVTTLGMAFLAAAAYGLGNQATAYRAEQRV